MGSEDWAQRAGLPLQAFRSTTADVGEGPLPLVQVVAGLKQLGVRRSAPQQRELLLQPGVALRQVPPSQRTRVPVSLCICASVQPETAHHTQATLLPFHISHHLLGFQKLIKFRQLRQPRQACVPRVT